MSMAKLELAVVLMCDKKMCLLLFLLSSGRINTSPPPVPSSLSQNTQSPSSSSSTSSASPTSQTAQSHWPHGQGARPKYTSPTQFNTSTTPSQNSRTQKSSISETEEKGESCKCIVYCSAKQQTASLITDLGLLVIIKIRKKLNMYPVSLDNKFTCIF